MCPSTLKSFCTSPRWPIRRCPPCHMSTHKLFAAPCIAKSAPNILDAARNSLRFINDLETLSSNGVDRLRSVTSRSASDEALFAQVMHATRYLLGGIRALILDEVVLELLLMCDCQHIFPRNHTFADGNAVNRRSHTGKISGLDAFTQVFQVQQLEASWITLHQFDAVLS